MQHPKIPQLQSPVVDLLVHRWSPRSFTAQAISSADMDTIIEAGTWAFSSSNEQPWRYIVAHHGTPLFAKLWGLLMPGNQPWCKNAAVLMIALTQTKMSNGSPNGAALHDLGAANFALTLQANSMGISTHILGGFDRARTASEIELPADVQPAVMIALGYRGEAEHLEEPFLTRELSPRSRKPVSEVVLLRES